MGTWHTVQHRDHHGNNRLTPTIRKQLVLHIKFKYYTKFYYIRILITSERTDFKIVEGKFTSFNNWSKKWDVDFFNSIYHTKLMFLYDFKYSPSFLLLTPCLLCLNYWKQTEIPPAALFWSYIEFTINILYRKTLWLYCYFNKKKY